MVVFLYQVSLSEAWLTDFVNQFALIPAHVSQWKDRYTLFTSMFMHGWWMHLIGNMVFLKIFWDNVEARIGNIKFLLFYLLAGLGADFLQIIVWPSVTVPNLGASWAISGVLGAYLLMFPHARVKMLNPSWGQIFYVSAKQFLLYWIGVQLLSWVWSLAATTGDEGGVAYFAHIGWFIAWVIGGVAMKKFATAWTLESSSGNILDQTTDRFKQQSDRNELDRFSWNQSRQQDPMEMLKEFLEQQNRRQ